MRQLLIFLVVLFGIWWLRRALSQPRDQGPGGSGRGRRSRGGAPERVLPCAHCGIHVPESEGVHADEAFYCCDDHRRKGPGR